MRIIVYLGPSTPLRLARERLEADYRPPVRHGDIWRALRDAPDAIAVIDGVFEHIPSVWHKEILEALDAGVHVFGASSMGALRAAELDAFGMVGVGRIYEKFRSGEWRDDDEVALAHGPAETGYVNLSLPMANVRFTLEAAEAAGVLTAEQAAAVATAAKGVHYPSRSWTAVDRAAPLDEASLSRLRAWRKTGAVDQKRADALALLDRLAALRAAPPPPFRPPFAYERTDLAEFARGLALGGSGEA